MVCDRCKMVVANLFKKNGVEPLAVQLGKVTVKPSSSFDLENLKKALDANGFSLLNEKEEILVAQIKKHLLYFLEEENTSHPTSLSSYLVNKIPKDYSAISKIFKQNEGQTLEHFYIKLRIEKAKEFIQMNELTFSEIAYQLHYKSISHLSAQFKKITGKTMSRYKTDQNWKRASLDQIV